MEKIRIQKYLSECGICSRRAAEELMLSGKVKVNGAIIKELGTKIDPTVDRVQVRNKFITAPHKGILLFYKPRAVVSTLSDPEGRKTIADYLTKQYVSYYPVGRLDYDSTGLVVLTNDGELAERLMHPRYGLERMYLVRVEGKVSEATIKKVARGVTLADGPARAVIEIEEERPDSTWLKVKVTEGRNRLVRRIMERVGNPVMKLKRVMHGPFKLGRLRPGAIQKLTEREYYYFRAKVFGEEPPKKRVRDRTPSRVRAYPNKSENSEYDFDDSEN
jgi:23S rRNA pseudouridine2605 synthase